MKRDHLLGKKEQRKHITCHGHLRNNCIPGVQPIFGHISRIQVTLLQFQQPLFSDASGNILDRSNLQQTLVFGMKVLHDS